MLIKDEYGLTGTVQGLGHFFLKRKLLLGLFLLVFYTIVVIGISSYMVKHGFWGTFLKPWIIKNINVPIDYFKSFSANPESIILDIKQKDILRLAHKRDEAMSAGTLYYSSEEDWVPAKFTHKDKTLKVKIRLKGTRASHWEDEEVWSYKVKMKKTDTFMGMRRFALQGPHNRNYLNEWIYQKLFGYLGVISLRYDFVEVTVNGKKMPVYAVEENFDKRLIENNQRREGPIFRAKMIPFLTDEPIDVYGMSKYKEDASALKLIHSVESLMEAFRLGTRPTSEVFDIEMLAKALAGMDLGGSFHSVNYSNIRFYYNPITGRVEPIPYDNQHIQPLESTQLLGEGHWISPETYRDIGGKVYIDGTERGMHWLFLLFQDQVFYKKYIEALEMISKKEYLDGFFNSIQEEQEEKLNTLYKSWPQYKFSGKKVIYSNQEYIRKILHPEKTALAYYEEIDSDSKIIYLNVANIHSLPIEVMGVLIADDVVLKPLGEHILVAKRRRGGPLLAGNTDLKNVYETLLTGRDGNSKIKYHRIGFKIPDNFQWDPAQKSKLKIQTKVFGTNNLVQDSIIPWDKQSDLMRMPSNVEKFSFLTIDSEKKVIQFKRGSWVLDSDLIVPSGFRLVAVKGTQIELTQKAKIITFSPVEFIGSQDDPVVFFSKNHAGQGIIVMNAKDESMVRHAEFSGLSNPFLSGWSVTGAVTFHESPATFINVKFLNNNSEDGLNLVRSKFFMEDVLFQRTLSDAFDSDFSTGKIKSITFLDCGNDGIDISGSQVEVDHIIVNGAGDKGVSAGENSQLSINTLVGKNANIVVASKDLSRVKIKEAKLENSKFGFAAFQKKSEFGAASIDVDQLEMADIELPFLIEKGSSLKIEGEPIQSKFKNIKKLLYPPNPDQS